MPPAKENDCQEHRFRLGQLESNFQQQSILLLSIRDELSRLSSLQVNSINQMTRAVYGNGEPGLIKDVLVLKERVDSIRRTPAQIATWTATILSLAGAAVGVLFWWHTTTERTTTQPANDGSYHNSGTNSP